MPERRNAARTAKALVTSMREESEAEEEEEQESSGGSDSEGERRPARLAARGRGKRAEVDDSPLKDMEVELEEIVVTSASGAPAKESGGPQSKAKGKSGKAAGTAAKTKAGRGAAKNAKEKKRGEESDGAEQSDADMHSVSSEEESQPAQVARRSRRNVAA